MSILKPFSRVTSSGRYVPEIDGLRCLAIGLVLLFHAHHLFLGGWEPLGQEALLASKPAVFLTQLPNFFIAKGWFGVQIFFVISGMVLALPYAGHHLKGSRKPELKRYFRRRLIRIETPYFIALSVFYVTGVLYFGGNWSDHLPNYLAGLIYSHTALYNGALNPILTVSWTLEIEIQFYLVAPFLCRIFALRRAWLRRATLIGLILLSDEFAGWANEVIESNAWGHSLVGQLSNFLVGLLLADFFLSYWQDKAPKRKTALLWDGVGLVAWPAVFFLMGRTAINWSPLLLLLGFAAVLRGHFLRRAFSNAWICAIGTMCYTIYLFHSFVFYGILCPYLFGPVIPITGGEWPFNYLLILIFCLTAVVICAGIFLVVEKPFAQGRLPWKKYPPRPAAKPKAPID